MVPDRRAGGAGAGLMRIVTLNVNGVRSAERKGFFPWLARQRADVVCLQEIKAQHAQLAAAAFRPRSFHCRYLPAERPGYSGVALFARAKPDRVIEGLGSAEFDPEGRYLEMRFGKLAVASLYAPSGSSGEARQAAKYRFLDELLAHLRARRRRRLIVCGDWNIAHREIDLENWRGNRKNSGFLPAERAWLDALYGEVGYVDCFREADPRPRQYTWWSNRGRAWEKNVGWRIDLQVASPPLAGCARRARIYKAKRFSDHAPLILDYELPA